MCLMHFLIKTNKSCYCNLYNFCKIKADIITLLIFYAILKFYVSLYPLAYAFYIRSFYVYCESVKVILYIRKSTIHYFYFMFVINSSRLFFLFYFVL